MVFRQQLARAQESCANSFSSSDRLRLLSNEVRANILRMIDAAGSGHIGSSLSAADVVTVLRFGHMRWDALPAARDTFVLSKGHAAPAWYAALIAGGDLETDMLRALRRIDSPLQGHPDRTRCEFVDASTGALGQGLSIAIGRAEAKKLRSSPNRVFCLLGDGECQEGQVWEAALYAGARRLDNIVAIVDANGRQSDGTIEDTLSLGDLARKFRAFDWHVALVDGHSHSELSTALEEAATRRNTPSLIVASTVKGRLAHDRQLLGGAHGGSLTQDDLLEALRLLEAAS